MAMALLRWVDIYSRDKDSIALEQRHREAVQDILALGIYPFEN